MTITLPQLRRGASGQYRSPHNDLPVISAGTRESYLKAVKVAKANNQQALQLLIDSIPLDAIAAIIEYDGKREEMSVADVLKFYIPCRLTVVAWLNGNEEPQPDDDYPFAWMSPDWCDELNGAMYSDEQGAYRDYAAVGSWVY